MALTREFEALLQEEPPDLLRMALLLRRLEEGPVEAETTEEALTALAAEVRGRREGGREREGLRLLNEVLFEGHGFRGNQEDYYDPRNSFLQEVLHRKVGIPITLSLLYLEVGRRAGLPLEGVGFPAHFLVRLEGPEEVFVDPFHGGRLMERGELPVLLEETTGGAVPFDPAFLEPVAPRPFIARMLRNLKAIYMRSEAFGRLLQVLDLLLLVDSDVAEDRRDRGLVHFEVGNFSRAREDLSRYLEMEPEAGDAEAIRAHLRDIESRAAMYR